MLLRALTLLCCTLSPLASAGAQDIPGDSAAAVAAVEAFHAALASADTTAALALLAPDAVVLESGGLETRAEYAAHHLALDIAFAQAIPAQRRVVTVRQDGDVVWVSSVATLQGRFRERDVNSRGAELMVLSHVGGVWTIRAIHWSSRART